MKHLVILLSIIAATTACKKAPEKTAQPPTAGSGSSAAPPIDAAAGSAGTGSAGSAGAAAWDGKSPLTLTDGFQTPESVLYDQVSDTYLVSNINGEPLGADDNGYIAKVSPDGKVTEGKWIDGAKDNVTLNAPKGMAITGGILYVADIDTVRKFDAKTGEPKGEIKIPGATFLNDVAEAPEGGVYVTDSGLDAKFGPTGTDAIWHVGKDDKAKAIIKDKKLAAPNGITAGEKGAMWVVTFGSGEIYSVDAKGKQAKGQKLPKGQLDGIINLELGDFLVSSWEGQAVYRGRPGGEWKAVVENIKSPADIGYDGKRRRILIPSFQGNTVTIQPTK